MRGEDCPDERAYSRDRRTNPLLYSVRTCSEPPNFAVRAHGVAVSYTHLDVYKRQEQAGSL